MRNFQRILNNMPIMPLLLAVKQQEALWDTHTLRTETEGTPHKDISDIWLRFNSIEQYPDAESAAAGVFNDLECVNYPGWYALPQARWMLLDLIRLVEGIRLGRVLITRLPPGKRIPRHADGGQPAEYYERYVVVLQNLPGSLMASGAEIIQMAAGEAWWMNNREEHEVVNNSEAERIVLIADIRPATP